MNTGTVITGDYTSDYCRKDGTESMLLTKYKVQELVENAKIDLDDLSQNVGAFLEDGIDDDSIALVYAAIDMLKEQIIDELGRVS